MKKFLATMLVTLCSAICFLPVAGAEKANVGDSAGVDYEGISAGMDAEKFYHTLPQAQGNYKSKHRPILIEGAMNIETEILVRALKKPVVYKDLNYLFVAGTYKDYPVVIVRTEQGMANAAASTILAIKKFNPVAVINQGTAGGHDAKLKINDIVIGESTIDYTAIKTAYKAQGEGADLTDQEMRGTFAYDRTTDTFQLNEKYFADPTLLDIAKSVAESHKEFSAVTGTISTADAWITNVDYINFLHDKYGSTCVEMETSCAAQICKNAGVPFIGIRVLSDAVLISSDYNSDVAKTAQDFVLLVAEKYISDVLKK